MEATIGFRVGTDARRFFFPAFRQPPPVKSVCSTLCNLLEESCMHNGRHRSLHNRRRCSSPAAQLLALRARDRCPGRYFPMRDVLRVVRVGPATWPAFHADANGRYTIHDGSPAAQRGRGGRAGAVLVLWPPTRGTHWPSGGRAVAALRAAEEEEGEEGGKRSRKEKL